MTLDYYLLAADGLLVEEFVHDRSHATVGLHAAVWRPAEPRWLGAASFSQAARRDPALLAQLTPTDRDGAARRSGVLPDEATLREAFLDYAPIATAPPLRLTPSDAPDGFAERRVYRVLFAKDLPVSPVPVSRRATATGDVFSWNLRRIGGGIAWGLDVTVLLAGPADDTIGPMLHELTTDVRRRHGLIPVTTERFA